MDVCANTSGVYISKRGDQVPYGVPGRGSERDATQPVP